MKSLKSLQPQGAGRGEYDQQTNVLAGVAPLAECICVLP